MAALTRRALLAGGALLLAGCGKDLAEEEPLPPADVALVRARAAEQELHAALDGLGAPAGNRELVRRLAARSAVRARRIAAAAGEELPPPRAATGDPEVAVERALAALAAHVEGLPSLTERRLRRLGTDLVVESAADLALLGAVYGAATVEAFPGSAT